MQDETRNIKALGFGGPYIRGFTVGIGIGIGIGIAIGISICEGADVLCDVLTHAIDLLGGKLSIQIGWPDNGLKL